MKLHEKVILFILNVINKIVFGSLKKKVIIPEETEKLINSGKVIIAMWHGKMFSAIYFFPKKLRKLMFPLVSHSKDGEFVAFILKKQGFNLDIRGSSSKGGVKALSLMIKKLKEGGIVLITPDGPKGPRRKLKDGVLIIAEKSHAPIICMSFKASRAKVFNSWDQFELPLPFSRMEIKFSKPYMVNNKEFEKHKENIERILNDLDA